jgi:hypothetical protein
MAALVPRLLAAIDFSQVDEFEVIGRQSDGDGELGLGMLFDDVPQKVEVRAIGIHSSEHHDLAHLGRSDAHNLNRVQLRFRLGQVFHFLLMERLNDWTLLVIGI